MYNLWVFQRPLTLPLCKNIRLQIGGVCHTHGWCIHDFHQERGILRKSIMIQMEATSWFFSEYHSQGSMSLSWIRMSLQEAAYFASALILRLETHIWPEASPASTLHQSGMGQTRAKKHAQASPASWRLSCHQPYGHVILCPGRPSPLFQISADAWCWDPPASCKRKGLCCGQLCWRLVKFLLILLTFSIVINPRLP